MRKFAAMLLSAVLCGVIFTFGGCDSPAHFLLTVTGETDLLIEPLEESYPAGETVTVKTNIVGNADVNVTINGTVLSHEVMSENGVDTHWEFTFPMPNKNSTLALKTGSAVQSPQERLIENKLAYYGMTSDSNIVGFRMNGYVNSLFGWEKIKPLVPNFNDGYDGSFFEHNALLVFFGEKNNGARDNIESTQVMLKDAELQVTILFEKPDMNASAPCVMAEWVIILEIENNIQFSALTMKTGWQ